MTETPPGRSETEVHRLTRMLDFLEWKARVIREAISWANEGFAGQLPSMEAPQTEGGRRHSNVRQAIHQLLSDHQPHHQDEIIDTVRAQLGEKVRIPAILSVLRGHPIRRIGHSYLLPDGVQRRRNNTAS